MVALCALTVVPHRRMVQVAERHSSAHTRQRFGGCAGRRLRAHWSREGHLSRMRLAHAADAVRLGLGQLRVVVAPRWYLSGELELVQPAP